MTEETNLVTVQAALAVRVAKSPFPPHHLQVILLGDGYVPFAICFMDSTAGRQLAAEILGICLDLDSDVTQVPDEIRRKML